jgi:hypothetical protein
MYKFSWIGLIIGSTFAVNAAAATVDAADAFSRYKAASGGASWDSVVSLESKGKFEAGGLSGTYTATHDVLQGHYRDEFTLGPVTGASGYDGNIGWNRDPGGEVTALDAAEAKRRQRSQAWLDARAYWYPSRITAQVRSLPEQTLDGKAHVVIEVTPDGGDPVTLWFNASNHLLTQTTMRRDQDTLTTRFDDYREVDGLLIAHRITTDVTDAAGRTDSRSRTALVLEHVTRNVPINDDDFAMPEMEAIAHIANATGITRIPFRLIANHIYIDGSIDGKAACFLVDTGGVNLLTPEAAKKFSLAAEGQLSARGVGEKAVDMSMAHGKEIRIGDAVLEKPLFYVIDLGDLAAIEGTECDGLVGYEMFRRFGVTIDYAKRELVLSEPAKFSPPANAHVVPFELSDRIPIVSGRLDGVPGRFSLDTGSRVSITLHTPFGRDNRFVERYSAGPEAVMGWGVGGPSRGRPARFGTLELGDLKIEGIAGDIHTSDKGAFASPDIAGNLGGGLFKRFTLAFDYNARRVYFAPNAANETVDAFDRSGLFLFADGDAIKAADVAKHSAAEKAGLREGDRILTVNGEKTSERTLDAWKQFMRETEAGTLLDLEFVRNGKNKKARLILADRIPLGSVRSEHADL